MKHIYPICFTDGPELQEDDPKAAVTENGTQAAIADVVNNVKKLREAARAYNIPVMALSDGIKTRDHNKSVL